MRITKTMKKDILGIWKALAKDESYGSIYAPQKVYDMFIRLFENYYEGWGKSQMDYSQ